MRYHDRRISYLEEIVRPKEREAEQSAAEANFQKHVSAWDRLAESMSPDHVEHLVAEIQEHGFVDRRGNVYVNDQASRLARTAASMVDDYVGGRLEGALVLPPEVGQVYLDDPGAHRLHDCAQCGYMLPFGPPRERGDGFGGVVRVTESRVYFTSCPLCGGRSGCNAYLYSQEGQIKRCQECGELHARTDAERRHLRRHGRPGCECSLPSERTEA